MHVRGARAYLSCVADDHIVVVQVLRSVSDTVGVKFALYPKFTVECGRRLNSTQIQPRSTQSNSNSSELGLAQLNSTSTASSPLGWGEGSKRKRGPYLQRGEMNARATLKRSSEAPNLRRVVWPNGVPGETNADFCIKKTTESRRSARDCQDGRRIVVGGSLTYLSACVRT